MKLLIEKIVSGKVSGDGVKKTPAYETPLTSHELEKWRKEFWGKSSHHKHAERVCGFSNNSR